MVLVLEYQEYNLGLVVVFDTVIVREQLVEGAGWHFMSDLADPGEWQPGARPFLILLTRVQGVKG